MADDARLYAGDWWAQETAELRHIGDGMQSAASRLSEYILKQHRSGAANTGAPYEVFMAALEAEDYVAQWTDARVGYATLPPTNESRGSDAQVRRCRTRHR